MILCSGLRTPNDIHRVVAMSIEYVSIFEMTVNNSGHNSASFGHKNAFYNFDEKQSSGVLSRTGQCVLSRAETRNFFAPYIVG